MTRTEVIEAIRGMSQDERDSIIAELQSEPEKPSQEELDFRKFITDSNRLKMEFVITEDERRIVEERLKSMHHSRPMIEFIEDIRSGKYENEGL